MPNKAVGNNPLFSSRGEIKLMTGKTGNQNTKKVKQVSSDSIKATAGKSNTRKLK